MKRLTQSMKWWLQTLHAGENPWGYIRGRSAHGGATRTEWALKQRGLITRDGKITQAGRDAIGLPQRKKNPPGA